MSVSEFFWSMLLGAEVMGIFVLILWICIGAWDAYKDRQRKARQKALRESKEAEAAKSAKDDKIFEEVEAFYDGI